MSVTNPGFNICADAARYALLRRLMPAMLHNMAGALQPIGMTAAIMEKRLQTAAPDLSALIKSSGNIKTLAKDASNTFMDLMTWLTPKTTQQVAVNVGTEDALGMVSTELFFRGFTIINEAASVCDEVPQVILRSVFMAALLALTDAAPSSGQVTIKAHAMNDEIVLEIAFIAIGNESLHGSSHAYRDLTWDDVQYLAGAEGVTFLHAYNTVTLRFAQRTARAIADY